MKNILKKVALLLTLCLMVGILAACGGAKTGKVTVINDDTMGKILGIDQAEYEKDTLLTVTVEPASGFKVISVKVNGAEVTLVDNQFALQVTGDITIETAYENALLGRADDPVLQARRDKAEAYMRQMATVKVMYEKDFAWIIAGGDYSVKGNIPYLGVPYATANTSLEGFVQAALSQTADGTYIFGGETFVDKWGYVLGCSSADNIYWSWAQFADSINFRTIAEMTERRGVLKVGDWVYERATYADTILICQENGEEVMYNSYAQLLKADAMLYYYNGSGHGLMIADNVVVKNADGTINPDESYVLTHDINNYYMEKEVDGVKYMTAHRTDFKITYTDLCKGGYLPLTCAELMDSSIGEAPAVVTDSIPKAEHNRSNLFKGEISCNYYISHYWMEISDKDGNVVQSAWRVNNEVTAKDFAVTEFTSQYMADNDTGFKLFPKSNMLSSSGLTKGETYHCKLTVHLGNGEDVVVRDFDFVN